MAAADRRTRILDAAEELFAVDGFDATPTARVAEAAKVPKGLVFYYFPHKIDLLLTLLQERLPTPTKDTLAGVVRRGDPAGSLVLRTIIFRESGTHPEVRDHLRQLRRSLVELTEAALDQAVEWTVAKTLRRQAAETFVSVMLDHANARRAGGALPDVQGAAAVVALAVGAPRLG
ncbi:MAG: helix-turn-helix domain-containing protein [Nocardioides sp.]|uniref:TetR/AcrR family transcriptional regulator n=1 Tax=Nocardioides sp. TaxID=35761 RepID=UPI003262DFE6